MYLNIREVWCIIIIKLTFDCLGGKESTMNNSWNKVIYRFWAPFYDYFFRLFGFYGEKLSTDIKV